MDLLRTRVMRVSGTRKWLCAAVIFLLMPAGGVAQQQSVSMPSSPKTNSGSDTGSQAQKDSAEPGAAGAPAVSGPIASPNAVSQVLPGQPSIATPVPGSARTSHGRFAVQAIPLNQPTASRLQARKSSYSVKVTGTEWIDTHLELVPGDVVTLSSKGEATLADGRKVTADGASRGWKDMLRQFPDNGSPTGALVARIGSDPAVVPFGVGAEKQMTVASGGELFLRINASSDLAPEGEFRVTLTLAQDKTVVHANAAAVRSEILALAPTLFEAVPRRVEDEQGNPGDMVNFALIGPQERLEKAFAAAGWVKVDNNAQDAVVHGVIATLAHKPYLELPMSTLYLFGRPQDFSYARADPITVAAERHHLRVWRTDKTVNGRPLWVGSSTHDVGFETDQRNGDVTHKIDPEVDKERDFLQQSFAAAGDLQSAAYVTPPDALHTATTATGGAFHSDGRIVVLDLK